MPIWTSSCTGLRVIHTPTFFEEELSLLTAIRNRRIDVRDTMSIEVRQIVRAKTFSA